MPPQRREPGRRRAAGEGQEDRPDEHPALAEELQTELTKWLPTAPLIEHTGAYLVGPKVGGFPGQSSGSTVFDARKVWVAQK